MRNRLQHSDGERGATLLEFALVAPVLLLLIFGAFEYGMFFKDYLTVPQEEAHKYPQTDFCGVWIAARAREMNCNCYKPFTEREFELLRQNLEEYGPDLIAMNLTSVPMRECAEVTRRIRQWMDVPIIWGGSGPTIEPERSLEHADMICNGEGEELIVELADAIDAGRDYSKLR